MRLISNYYSYRYKADFLKKKKLNNRLLHAFFLRNHNNTINAGVATEKSIARVKYVMFPM